MLRIVAIAILLLCAFAGRVAAQPNKTTSSKHTSAQPETPFRIEHQEITAEAKDKSQPSSPPWYTSPEWWLFIANVGVLFAIIYQARKSSEATTEMRKSIQLQETAMRQWVATEDWKVDFRMLRKDEGVLDFQIYVVNPSKLPLTFRVLSISFDQQHVESGNKTLLVPDERYYVYFAIHLDAAQTARYISDTIRLDLVGNIFYRDTFEKERIQIFGKTCVLGSTQAMFMPYQGVLPEALERRVIAEAPAQ
jgi:hypothetical protein